LYVIIKSNCNWFFGVRLLNQLHYQLLWFLSNANYQLQLVILLFKLIFNYQLQNHPSLTDELKSPIQLLDAILFVFNLEFVGQFSWELVTSEAVVEFVTLFAKMLTLNLSETTLSVGSMTAVLAWKFNFLGRFVSKLTSLDDHSNNNRNNNNNNNVTCYYFNDVLSPLTLLA